MGTITYYKGSRAPNHPREVQSWSRNMELYFLDGVCHCCLKQENEKPSPTCKQIPVHVSGEGELQGGIPCRTLPSSIIQSMWTVLTKHLQQPGFEQDTDGQTRIEADNDSPQQASIFTSHTCSSLPFPYVNTWPRTTNPDLFSPLQNLKSQIRRKAELVFQKKNKQTQVSFPK